MQKVVFVCLVVFLLGGCGSESNEMDRAVNIRNMLLQSDGCEFTAVVTADYVSSVYTFTMDCKLSKEGTVSFCVAEPDGISGISGKLSAEGGEIQFTDTVLAFHMLADGELSPVSAPWIMMNALRSGYIRACGYDGEFFKIAIADSYEEDALMLEILFDSSDMPVYGEVLYNGRRSLAIDIRNFRIV